MLINTFRFDRSVINDLFQHQMNSSTFVFFLQNLPFESYNRSTLEWHRKFLKQLVIRSYSTLVEIIIDFLDNESDWTFSSKRSTLCTFEQLFVMCSLIEIEFRFQALNLLYGKILRDLKKIPETSAYRKHTEEIVNSRLTHVQTVRQSINVLFHSTFVEPFQEPNIARLERKINCGQIEEVIVQVCRFILSVIVIELVCFPISQAENELMCVRRMSLNNVWEPLAASPPPNQWKWPIV